MSTTKLSYTIVSDACQAILADNEVITIRKIHQRTGGSFSTISKHYQQWVQEQSLIQSAEHEISAPFKAALVSELGRATAALKKNLEEVLSAERAQLKEVQGLLAQQESQCETLAQELSLLKQEAEQKSASFMKQVAAADALIEASHQREQLLKTELEAIRKECHEAELRTAIAETKYQELQKQNIR